jgi:hypothetical protein
VSERWDVNEAAIRAFRTPEEGENYLDRILACCKDASSRVRRLLLLLILFMALFELLIELKSPTNIATFLPVIVAYLEYKLVRQMLYWRRLQITFAAVITAVQPGVAENRLASYLVPTIPLLSNRQPKGAPFENVFSFQDRTEEIFASLCAFLLPTFQVYALSQLYEHMNGRPTIAFIASGVMTIILTIAYLAVIVMLVSHVIRWRFYETLSKRIRASEKGFWPSGAAFWVPAQTKQHKVCHNVSPRVGRIGICGGRRSLCLARGWVLRIFLTRSATPIRTRRAHASARTRPVRISSPG